MIANPPYRAPSIAPSAKDIAKKHKEKRRHKRMHKHPHAAGAGVQADINITPLVDVVLVLLIIFMVVTPMLHRGVDLELPKTDHHSTRQDTGEQIVVSVRQDGVYVEADKIDVEKLAGFIEGELKKGPHPVNVKADKGLKFGEVRKVLEQVHASGAAQVNLETKENKAE